MARTAATLQQHEIEAFEAFAAKHGIKLNGEEGVRNGSILGGDIINRNQDITQVTLSEAFSRLRDQLTLKSRAEMEYETIAAENPTVAQQLATWFENQKLLVNTGDEGFSNQTSLLTALRGRAVSWENIHWAINYIQSSGQSKYSQAKRPLVFVEKARKTVEEGYRPGRFITDSKQEREAAAIAAAEAAKKANPQKTSVPDAWEQIAKNHLGAGQTHSQREALKGLFEQGSTGQLTWRDAATKMAELKRSFQLVRF
jgi:hypothetical protein